MYTPTWITSCPPYSDGRTTWPERFLVFYSTKFQRHIEEMLVSPMPNWIIVAGYVTGGVARGICVAVVVTAVALVFSDVSVRSPLLMVVVIVLTATLFSCGGFINAMLARSFDDVSIVPTFILTPLTYLGGVFYLSTCCQNCGGTRVLAIPSCIW